MIYTIRKLPGATHENSLGFKSQLLIVRCRDQNFRVCNETYFLISRRPIRNLVWEMFRLVAYAQCTKNNNNKKINMNKKFKKIVRVHIGKLY